MPLHIVVPGLLWPRDTIENAARGLALPALAVLAGRGRHAWTPPQPVEHWLCRAFGLAAEPPPCAALRWLGEGGEAGADAWLCADPAHLRFSRNALVIGGVDELDLAPDEAAEFVAALNAGLGEAGIFHAPHPHRWYLRLRAPVRIATHPRASVVGRALEAFLPGGEDARAWRHLANEAQVLLHNHPLNAAREARGAAAVNSLWFWGAGTLAAATRVPAAQLIADDPLARGLARHAGMARGPLPATARQADLGTNALLLLDRLAAPAQALDAPAWRAALAAAEADWFMPLLAALRASRLDGLRLTAFGDDGTFDILLRPRDLWKVWRRPLPLPAWRLAA